jgi:predicted metal-dependent hydrolase
MVIDPMNARFREGIRLFNDGRFFESHEAWEEVYLQAEGQHKPFIEALVQLAAAFRIFSDFGEIRGPVRMIYQALIRFENYEPVYLDIEVKELSDAMEAWARAVEKGTGHLASAIPKIRQQRLGVF